jgi:hypothetical protein
MSTDAKNNRDFKGIWIPKEIWLSKELTVMEKLFLVEIDSLDNDFGCVKSNAAFASFFDISKGRCTQIIRSLEEKKHIKIQLERKGKQVIKRTIRVVRKLTRGGKNTKQGWLENDEGSNTLVSNTKDHTQIRDLVLALWLKFYPNHPQPIKSRWIGSSRDKKLVERIKENEQHQQLEFWEWFISGVSKLDWYGADQAANWKTLEWFLKRENFDKCLEKLNAKS